jgi:hypothetical protein
MDAVISVEGEDLKSRDMSTEDLLRVVDLAIVMADR